jgi:hypothetical protein
MKRFPFSRLQIREAVIESSLRYNAYPPYHEPKIRWSIEIEIEPLELKDDAFDPDLEKVVDSNLELEELDLNVSSWRDLAGVFESLESQDGSFYVSSAHNLIEVVKLTMTFNGGTGFTVDATLRFCFELENSGYQDEIVRLVFPATYRGFRFRVPRWNEPVTVRCPDEWGVPSNEPEWTDEQILGFVERYIDLAPYEAPVIKDHNHLSAKPARPNPYPD